MSITPDSRAGGMGDAGTALSADASSLYWNTSGLSFAKEKSEAGIKEALFAGRTLAVFHGFIAGKENLIKSLIKESLEIRVINQEKGVIEVTNHSDLQYVLKHGKFNLNMILPGKVTRMMVKQGMEVEFSNCVIAEEERLKMKLW
jgi:hypothetical protein